MSRCTRKWLSAVPHQRFLTRNAALHCNLPLKLLCSLQIIISHQMRPYSCLDNLVRFRTKSFYHLDIGTFSLNNMCGSKLVAVWLTDINILSHFILFTFFTILLPEWSKAWKGFAVSSYQTVACNVISGKEISNAFDKLKITSERRSSIKSNTPRNIFNFLFIIQNGSYKYW